MSRAAKVTGTILNGASLSDEIACGGLDVVGILLPATWTAAAVTLQAGDGVTFGDVHNQAGELSLAGTGAGRYIVSVDLPQGCQSLKVRSGTAAVPVNQLADRTITVFLRG